ncbi:MAG: class I SAM-dependent methyltransferase [Bacilli bacterium]|nr:class I SAM-dependent methyltransferase [Bacilli bacterium]MBN2877012.1 class I SAM-dependent methyltransferase [Bacilli bacterium]
MSHYFTNNKDLESKEKPIYFKVQNIEFHFITDNGVFSKSGLDFGSRLLLETVLNINSENLLDLGCGYGPIGLIYKYFHRETKTTLIDVNERAVEVARKNAQNMGLDAEIIVSDMYEKIHLKFDLILSNPPIRAGKDLLHRFFQESIDHLEADGSLIYVIHKNLGAKSSIAFCEGIYKQVEILERKSGYYIIQCRK